MSKEASQPTATKDEKSVFSERETNLVIAAMLSLKTGLPDIDYTRFQKNGNFNTLKTAQNTWGTLKKKILNLNPDAVVEAPATPKVPKTTPKKRTKKEADDNVETADSEPAPPAVEETPAKKAKTARGKKAATEPDGIAVDDDDVFVAPKAAKKPRKSPAKKVIAGKDEEPSDAGKADTPVAEESAPNKSATDKEASKTESKAGTDEDSAVEGGNE